MATVTTRTIDMRVLCLHSSPNMYSDREPAYNFSGGRSFTNEAVSNITQELEMVEDLEMLEDLKMT